MSEEDPTKTETKSETKTETKTNQVEIGEVASGTLGGGEEEEEEEEDEKEEEGKTSAQPTSSPTFFVFEKADLVQIPRASIGERLGKTRDGRARALVHRKPYNAIRCRTAQKTEQEQGHPLFWGGFRPASFARAGTCYYPSQFRA